MQELQVRRPKNKKTQPTRDLTATQNQNWYFRVVSLCQEMEKTIAELSHQQVQLLENINSKKKSLALMRKDRRETKELHRDKLEVLMTSDLWMDSSVSSWLRQTDVIPAAEETPQRGHSSSGGSELPEEPVPGEWSGLPQHLSHSVRRSWWRLRPPRRLVAGQEAQERQEQWEEDAKQLLQEKERQYNNIGCRKTLNFDKLSELSRAVSSDRGAGGVEPTSDAGDGVQALRNRV